MRPPAISLDELVSLPPVCRAVIPPDYEDRNRHMNMRWYLALYDEAGDAMYPMLGLTPDYFAASGMGGVDLEHHIWYSSEVHIGETVLIRFRMLARSLKLFQYMMFMVNETRGVLSSLFECVHAHADLRARRTAPLSRTRGGPDRRLHRRAPCADLARAGVGVHGRQSYTWIVALSLTAPVTIIVMAALMMLLGLYSFFSMSKDIFPAVNIPEVKPVWYYPGMSAPQIDPPETESGSFLHRIRTSR